MKFVIATKNKNKLEEFQRILKPFGIEALSQEDVGIDIDVVENGSSFIDNAKLKAKAIFNKCKIPTIADDSGLEVFALNNDPGIFSARYGGEFCKTDLDRTKLLLENMKNIDKNNRGARFVCAIYVIFENGDEHSIICYCDGDIGFEIKGANGFGYDPVFMVGEKSFAEIDSTQKDNISHRGKALRQFENIVKSRYDK